MSKRLVYVAGAVAPCMAAAVCSAAPVVFALGEGGTGSAYEIVLDDAASVDVARGEASAAGGGAGHLLTITSAAEQAFVEQMLMNANAPTGSYWLDLDRAGDGDGDGDGFAWGTGEAFAFSNFAAGEPNAFLGVEDAGQIYWSQDVADDIAGRRGQWNDAPATGYPNDDNGSFPTPDLARAGYIVEYELGVGGRPGEGEGPVAIPLPAAAVAAPLVAVVAGFAARRMRRRKAE